MNDDIVFDALMQLAADEAWLSEDHPLHSHAGYRSWLAEDIRDAESSIEMAISAIHARDLAWRIALRARALHLARRLPLRELRYRSAPVIARVFEAERVARHSRCSPLIELPVAAGQGMELWDEPCERWIELPSEVPDLRYLAIRVRGDSMKPLLESSDVILVSLGAPPVVDDVIVAKRPDDGYVVKRVAEIGERSLKLDSLNPDYATLYVPRDDHSVLGTVIARFRET